MSHKLIRAVYEALDEPNTLILTWEYPPTGNLPTIEGYRLLGFIEFTDQRGVPLDQIPSIKRQAIGEELKGIHIEPTAPVGVVKAEYAEFNPSNGLKSATNSGNNLPPVGSDKFFYYGAGFYPPCRIIEVDLNPVADFPVRIQYTPKSGGVVDRWISTDLILDKPPRSKNPFKVGDYVTLKSPINIYEVANVRTDEPSTPDVLIRSPENAFNWVNHEDLTLAEDKD